MHNLTDDQRRSVLSRCHARLDALWAVIEDRTAEPAVLQQWARDRDELEGVRLLLARAGIGESLEDRLDRFDHEAEVFIADLPLELLDSDDQLQRAALIGPLDWWAARNNISDPNEQ